MVGHIEEQQNALEQCDDPPQAACIDDDTTFRVAGAIDVTERYLGWGVGAGLWR